MIKGAASRVMWVGRATVFLVGLVVLLALVFGVATTALAGTGVGAVFNLGKTNTVDAISKLVGSTAGSMLLVDNNGAGPALDLKVGSAAATPASKTTPPMKVDSQAKVTNLNADELDGRDSSTFVPAKIYYVFQHENTSNKAAGYGSTLEVGCDGGDLLLSGGFVHTRNMSVTRNWMKPEFIDEGGSVTPPLWQVESEVDSQATLSYVEAYAYCADTNPGNPAR